MTDISVRSALMRVRWNDIPVRRDASSVEILAESDCEVTRTFGFPSILSPSEYTEPAQAAENHLHRKGDLQHA
jgi:hypothetical protein